MRRFGINEFGDMYSDASGEYCYHKDVKKLESNEDRMGKCFERIAKAVGLTTPLELIAEAENNDENYAEILARHIERKYSQQPTDFSK